MTDLAILYTLIVVTFGGGVTHSDGYTSLALCEDAKSIALTGKTVEQEKAYLEAMRTAQINAFDWQDTHPGSEPKTAEEKRMVAKCQLKVCPIFSGGVVYKEIKEGLIYDVNPYANPMDAGHATNIQYVQCVIVPPVGTK